MKLKSKFFLIFMILSIIPALIIMVIVYNRYTIQTQQQMTDVFDQIFISATDEANECISDVNHVLESMAFYTDADHSIINDLQKYTERETFTAKDIYDSNNNLKFMIQNLIYSSDNLNGIFIFTPSGQTLGYGNNIDIRLDYVADQDAWYQNTLALEGKTYVNGISKKDFLVYAKPSISFSKALYDVYSHKFLGVLFIDCKPEIFDLSKVNTLPQTVLLSLEYEDGSLLYSSVDSLTRPRLDPGSPVHIQKTNLDLRGVSLTASATPSELYQEFNVTKRLILILSVTYILLFLLISFLLSRYLTTPIIYLSSQMSNHKLHSYVTKEKYLNRTDEIGVLYNEYNSMLEEQQKYIKDEYQNKLITLDSQMKSLEAQINSHFLYNTLESINSLAEIQGIESISIMSMALGNMFRYSIKTSSELVPVHDEISNVLDYVSIQRIRFSNRFQLLLEIPSELYQCKVLKLIFQPLVENALLHGLDRCGMGDTITITGFQRENSLYFQIKDNGVGMDASQVAAIEETLSQPPLFKDIGRRSTQSIGLKNICSRIELYYGAGYGLTVSSTLGVGTTISLKLPYIKQEDLS